VSGAREKALRKGVPDPGLDLQAIGTAVERMVDAVGERVRTSP
jgi:hypothetical protein